MLCNKPRMLFIRLAFAALALASFVSWQSFLDPVQSRVRFGVTLEGEQPFRIHENDSFAPASTAKLFTAGAVLATLGADYRYPTVIRWNEAAPGTAAGLEIVGSGDPSYGMGEFHESIRDRFNAAAAALKAAGISRVLGEPRAVAADPRWNNVAIPDGWRDSDWQSCEGTLAQAFNFNLNCGALVVTSATQAAWRAEGLDYPVVLSIRSGSSTSLGTSLTRGANGALTYKVSGTFAAGGGPRTLIMPVYDTRAWARNLFRNALAAQGITFSAYSGAPAGEAKQLVLYSRPLSELIKPFLKNSINFMGDAFLKTVGATSPGTEGSLLTAGLEKLCAFLRQEAGDIRDLSLHDGSGLSRTSRVTPELMLRYLERVKNEKYFPALYAALPIAAVDGTLRNRMGGTAAAGLLHAKTGTLSGVYNLAGFVPNGHDYVPFVILTSTTADNNGAARSTEDRIGARLAEVNHSEVAAPIFVDASTVEPYPYFPEHAGQDNQ
jgi:D-alanyl-D-alanine carboxypeptidase/D-alanyl-D-alanine-endopeptidase (penicillin-binding protein 4)